jgi:hypothetical protein
MGRVEGAIKGARDIGLSAEEAAAAAGPGALRAAAEIGGSAVDRVRDVLKGTISGVKVVVKEPFARGDPEVEVEEEFVEEEVLPEEGTVADRGTRKEPAFARDGKR